MKKGVFQIVTLAVFVILLSVTLCACNAFNRNISKNEPPSGILPTTKIDWNMKTAADFEYKEVENTETKEKEIVITGLKNEKENHIVIPDGVARIDDEAFAERNNIISVTIPDSVTSVGYRAFSDCTGLISVSIGKNVTSIEYGAFSGCSKLIEVYNKSTLSFMVGSVHNGGIGNYAKNIYSKEGKTKLDVDENEYIIYEDGDEKILMGYSGRETELTLPDEVTEIYHYAFAKNGFITSVALGKNTTVMGDYAFANCAALKSVTFGDKIKNISYGAFYHCYALSSVIIPDCVTSISEQAFLGCMSLTNVTVGVGMKIIEDDAFSSCYKLIEVYNRSSLDIVANGNNDGDNETGSDIRLYGKIGEYAKNVYKDESGSKLSTDEDGYVIYEDNDKKILVNYTKNDKELVFPQGITEIYENAFYSRDTITKVEIPDGVTTIGQNAFYGCAGLTEITIPSSVTEIEDYAFKNCTGLTALEMPQSVTDIKYGVFNGCTGLTNIVIPDSVERVHSYAFAECSGLKSITISSINTNVDSYAFDGCDSIESAKVPTNATRSIPKTNLKTVVITDGETIESYAFV